MLGVTRLHSPVLGSATFLQGPWHLLDSAPSSVGRSPCLQCWCRARHVFLVRQGFSLGLGSELCCRSVVSLYPTQLSILPHLYMNALGFDKMVVNSF